MLLNETQLVNQYEIRTLQQEKYLLLDWLDIKYSFIQAKNDAEILSLYLLTLSFPARAVNLVRAGKEKVRAPNEPKIPNVLLCECLTLTI